MKKKKFRIIISLFFASFSMFFSPIYVDAKSDNLYINNSSVKILVPTTSVNMLVACDADPACQSDAPLGNKDCECSVAWLLQKVLDYMKILGPTIAIVLGSIDFAKAIITSDEENMKKTEIKFVKRIVAAVMLFFIPLLVEMLLGIVGLTGSTTGLS